MKKKFFKALIYYRIIHFLLAAILLWPAAKYILQQLSKLNFLQINDTLFFSAAYACLFYAAICSVRKQHYKKKTGRSYTADHQQFKKSYSELLEFFSTNDSHKLDLNTLPVKDWHSADGVILGQIKDATGNIRLIHRPSDANGNLIAFGLPGSGKTTTQAATTALRFNADHGCCGIFAISIKGDLLNFVREKRPHIKVLTPDNAIGSCHFNPLSGLENMSWTDRKIFIENLAIIICPEEPGDNTQFFVSGARDYLCGIALYLLEQHDTGQKKGNLKFTEIIDTILSTDVFSITKEIKKCKNPIPGTYTNGFLGSSEKNVAGIWSHLCKRVRPLLSGGLRTIFSDDENYITPEDLDHYDIYIDVPQDKYTIYAPAISIIVTKFLLAFMRRPDVSADKHVTPVLFLLDEVIQLKLDFSLLSQAMATLRSKKVSLFLLAQSIAQFQEIYGTARTRELMDLCAYISVFNAQDPDSRCYFQQLVGKKKMLQNTISTTSNNESGGTSVMETEQWIIAAADLGNLNSTDRHGHITYHVLIYANGKYAIADTTPCYK